MSVVKIAALALPLIILALAGCAVDGQVGAVPTPTPTATVEYATENQVASVLSEYNTDWRETIDAASSCRMTFVLGSDAAQTYICKTQEQTIGITTQLVHKGWAKLDVPPSMQDLVAQTDDVLVQIGDIDLDAACGDGSWGDAGDACNAALGDRFALYTSLEKKLDAWTPYL